VLLAGGLQWRRLKPDSAWSQKPATKVSRRPRLREVGLARLPNLIFALMETT
jgi:hypothetical protein